MHEHLKKISAAYSSEAETTFSQRFNAIIDYVTTPTRRWKELEELTGIATHSWQKAYLGKQRPTAEMLEAVSRHWPSYCFWMMTGLTNLEGFHLCPPGAHPWPSTPEELDLFEGNTDTFWQTELQIKKLLAEESENVPQTPSEEAEFKAEWDKCAARLFVSETLRQVLAKNRRKKE